MVLWVDRSHEANSNTDPTIALPSLLKSIDKNSKRKHITNQRSSSGMDVSDGDYCGSNSAKARRYECRYYANEPQWIMKGCLP